MTNKNSNEECTCTQEFKDLYDDFSVYVENHADKMSTQQFAFETLTLLVTFTRSCMDKENVALAMMDLLTQALIRVKEAETHLEDEEETDAE